MIATPLDLTRYGIISEQMFTKRQCLVRLITGASLLLPSLILCTPSKSTAQVAAPPTPSMAAGSALQLSNSPAPSTSHAVSAAVEFQAKFDAARVQFEQNNYPLAKKLLDEADALQPHQPDSAKLRAQLFRPIYEEAYTAYRQTDYVAALEQLDTADSVGTNVQDQSDAYNLRGLVLSRQSLYAEAEKMFQKAAQVDPGLWAAKFNYAATPFNYHNFTLARSRFEDLLSQTDPAKQPLQAELIQFKVFLTLLLEGKEEAARTFMQHLRFGGATPAREFCQAAIEFYHGDVDKAQGWIEPARKAYPANKSLPFVEACRELGWLPEASSDRPIALSTPGEPLPNAQ